MNADGTVMKRARLTIAHALALVALGPTVSVRADDLPSEIVARPATLPHQLIAPTLAGGYDSAHVLGISVLSTTQLRLAVQRGMTHCVTTDDAGHAFVCDPHNFDPITR